MPVKDELIKKFKEMYEDEMNRENPNTRRIKGWLLAIYMQDNPKMVRNRLVRAFHPDKAQNLDKDLGQTINSLYTEIESLIEYLRSPHPNKYPSDLTMLEEAIPGFENYAVELEADLSVSLETIANNITTTIGLEVNLPQQKSASPSHTATHHGGNATRNNNNNNNNQARNNQSNRDPNDKVTQILNFLRGNDQSSWQGKVTRANVENQSEQYGLQNPGDYLLRETNQPERFRPEQLIFIASYKFSKDEIFHIIIEIKDGQYIHLKNDGNIETKFNTTIEDYIAKIVLEETMTKMLEATLPKVIYEQSLNNLSTITSEYHAEKDLKDQPIDSYRFSKSNNGDQLIRISHKVSESQIFHYEYELKRSNDGFYQCFRKGVDGPIEAKSILDDVAQRKKLLIDVLTNKMTIPDHEKNLIVDLFLTGQAEQSYEGLFKHINLQNLKQLKSNLEDVMKHSFGLYAAFPLPDEDVIQNQASQLLLSVRGALKNKPELGKLKDDFQNIKLEIENLIGQAKPYNPKKNHRTDAHKDVYDKKYSVMNELQKQLNHLNTGINNYNITSSKAIYNSLHPLLFSLESSIKIQQNLPRFLIFSKPGKSMADEIKNIRVKLDSQFGINDPNQVNNNNYRKRSNS
ncbi:MAG: hypothetical protein H0W64_11650 [Gammaproteobacteria bacterium]|nr:hypothetical protein [Gammaproteobacteria bacterium]